MRISILTILIATILVTGCKSTQKSTATLKQPEATIQNIEIEETYWKLTELQGKPIVKSEGMTKDIHIILKKDGNRVQGFSGCNTIMGQYELKEGNRIVFSGMASTMMACPDMSTEANFNKMLGAIDNYSINGKTMSLSKAKMAPMARFEAVDGKGL